MSSRRKSRSRERKNLPSKLRMDDNIPPPRITDPSLPAGRRREIDNVMKKARAQNSPTSSAIWEKKLLEVEAKDSNRWRHSGYKSLYLDGGTSSRSRSRSRSFSSTRRGGAGASSPSPRRARSPRARSPRSPPPRARSPRSPPPRGRSPRSPPSRRVASPPMGYRGGRPRTPPSPRKSSRCVRRSASASSLSSCSDDSCSVCSPKPPRHRSRSRSFSPPPRPSASSVAVRKPPPPKPSARPRPPSPSPPPPRRMPRPITPPVAKRMPRPSSSDRPTDPRTRPPPPPPRPMLPKPGQKIAGEKIPLGKQALLTRIKKEGARKKRPGSPGGESSGSEDSGVSTSVPIVATTAMTLSERFGKIAQWSADRERRDIENMRITKTGSNMKVMVEEDEFLYGTPPRRYSISPVPQGHYPDELLSAGQSRLAAWDDVRVRYQYYKDLGYLRDLSLDDYVKWEEWWYKYQDWLANERHYEHWFATHGHSGGRRRKKRVPASQRLGT